MGVSYNTSLSFKFENKEVEQQLADILKNCSPYPIDSSGPKTAEDFKALLLKVFPSKEKEIDDFLQLDHNYLRPFKHLINSIEHVHIQKTRIKVNSVCYGDATELVPLFMKFILAVGGMPFTCTIEDVDDPELKLKYRVIRKGKKGGKYEIVEVE